MSEEKNRPTEEILSGFLWDGQEAEKTPSAPSRSRLEEFVIDPADFQTSGQALRTPTQEAASALLGWESDPEPEPVKAGPKPESRKTEEPKANVRKKEESHTPSAVASFLEIVEIFAGALIAAILVLTLICRTGVVSGGSMNPTMEDGDRYLISDLFYTPAQGDIVVFRPGIRGEEDMWIKRVIAVGGQTVFIDPDSNEVYVDGQLLSEPYLSGAITVPHSTLNPITVPEGSVFVMGDNRLISHDSRYSDLGCVEVGQLAGRVLFRFWPFDKLGACD